MLCFSVSQRHWASYRVKPVVPWTCQAVGLVFPTAGGSLLISVSQFGNSCDISNFFIIVTFLTVVCDQWVIFDDVTLVIVLGCQELGSYKTANLINKCYMWSDANWLFPDLSSLSQTLHSLRHNNIEIRPISNCAVSSKGSSERKSHEALTLNEKPEIIKLSKEGMSKA